MGSLNSVSLTGRLARRPELSGLPEGRQTLEMCVEVGGGECAGDTSIIDCVLYGERAEGLARVLTSGSKVALLGSLRKETWSQGGLPTTKVVVVVEVIDLMQKTPSEEAWLYQDYDMEPEVY